MKKAGKIISYLLVLTLVTSLFAGLGFKTESVSATVTGPNFKVLEIVPDVSMGTFGYFVDGYFGMGKTTVSDNDTIKTLYTHNGKLRKFLKNKVCANRDDEYVSNDFFVENVLKSISDTTWNVTVVTRSPKTLGDDDIATADMIIINETVPKSLQVEGVVNKTFNDSGYELSDHQVLKIFEKIAGVNGNTPVPYIIDFAMYHGDQFTDVRKAYHPDDYGKKKWGFVRADQVDKLSEGDDALAYLLQSADKSPYMGTNKSSFKLYKLLSCIDPGTLYGLYFAETDGTYGIVNDPKYLTDGTTEDVLKLVYEPTTKDGNNSPYNVGARTAGWTDELFRPNYLFSGIDLPERTSAFNDTTLAKDMSWFEVDTIYDQDGKLDRSKPYEKISDFCQSIGAGAGRGLVYKSSNGLFSIFKATSGEGGFDWTEVDVAASLKEKGNKDNNNAKHYQNVKIGTKAEKTIDTWRFVTELDWVEKINFGGTDYTPSEGQLAVQCPWNLNSGNQEFNIDVYANKDLNDDDIKELVNSFTFESGSKVSGESYIGKLLGILGANASKNDYHQYRFLVVSKEGVSSTVNRSIVYKMVKEANLAGYGLPGGVVIDCMSRYQFDNATQGYNESSSDIAIIDNLNKYDAICIEGGSGSLFSVGSSKLSDYSGTTVEFSSDGLVGKFKQLLGKSFGVDFVTVPTEYYTNFRANFTNENGWDKYTAFDDIAVAGNRNYINPDSNKTKRSLDFNIRVYGSGASSIDLYVDADGDCKFESNEKKHLSDGTNYSDSVSLSEFFKTDGDSFVGGFAWRVVVSGSGQKIYRDGYSAVKNHDSTKKNKIKILQIYPTDYKAGYAPSNADDQLENNPLLILPTKSEIQSVGSLADIEEKLDDMKLIFDDKLTIDVASSSGIGNKDEYGTDDVSPNKVKTSDSNAKRDGIVYNSSIFYYFFSKLTDYEMDVTRYSVNGFNKALRNNELAYNSETGRIGSNAGIPVKNLDGSNRYGYTPTQLFGNSNKKWKDDEYLWTEGPVKRYMVDDLTGLIYGERKEADGSFEYYGSSKGTEKGKAITNGTNEDSEFDVVVLGFGSNMDYMSDAGVKFLVKYLKNGGTAFIGNGAVTKCANNTLSEGIVNIIGMSSDKEDPDYFNRTNDQPLTMVTNDTLFSHYPYSIEGKMFSTAGARQPYNLNLAGNDAPVVAFTKYQKGSSKGYGIWGSAERNYYLYKKGNITFCGFGNTFPDMEMKQNPGVMTMAETLMIVNALVASSRFGAGGIHAGAYMDCIDPDRSVLDESVIEGDYEEYHFKDAIYTDYDAAGIAKFAKSSETEFNTPIESDGLKPEGFTDAGTGVRWIPYKTELATESGAYVEFFTPDGKDLKLKMYEYNGSTFTGMNGGAPSHKFHVKKNGIYYIGVPIENAIYKKGYDKKSESDSLISGTSSYANKLGFLIDKDSTAKSVDQFSIKFNLVDKDSASANIIEDHTVMMIRRVLYHTK